MADHPDIYADGFSVTAGPFGVTLTLRRSEPTGKPGQHEDPSVIVARIRLAHNTAKAIAAAMIQIVEAASKQPQQDTKTTVSH